MASLKKELFFILVFLLVGGFFRLYHVDFGLPHSFHADEPEIGEFAIKYTYDIRRIASEGTYYELIPISFVYGTFPVYFNTAATMLFSKVSNLVGSGFDKTSIYLFLRTLNSVLSLLILPALYVLYKRLFAHEQKSRVSLGALFVLFFAALNWKLIAHAHYLNADIIVAVLLVLSYLAMFMYYDREEDTKYTILAGIFVGFAFGTKVTALLTIPLYIYLFLSKKDLRNMGAFLFVVFGAFVLSNPFHLAFAQDFALRTYMLTVKENGLVFDSVDLSHFKYLRALFFISSPLVLLNSLYGIYISFKHKININLHVFLVGSLLMYLAFYSMGSRRVDRWLLPVLPIVLLYASHAFVDLRERLSRGMFALLIVLAFSSYLYYPSLLLRQYDTNTPKTASYLWARDNLEPAKNKLVITKEGLDPLNKLRSVTVLNQNVYESNNGQYQMPPDPIGYHYIFVSSRSMSYFKNPVVAEKYPFYTEAWQEFEDTLLDESRYKLIKSFTLPKPNLVELDDVYVYESLILDDFGQPIQDNL